MPSRALAAELRPWTSPSSLRCEAVIDWVGERAEADDGLLHYAYCRGGGRTGRTANG